MTVYVQPIAQHARYPERLLLDGEDGRCYVWLGQDVCAAPQEIDRATAGWLRTLPIVRLLTGAPIWLSVTDLPVAKDGTWVRVLGD